MNVDIKDYLNDEELENIARESFTNACENKCNALLSKESDLTRILTNAAYMVVFKMVEEQLDEDLCSVLRDKVVDIIGDLSDFHLFRKPDAWDRTPRGSTGYEIVSNAIQDNKEIITRKVIAEIESIESIDIGRALAESVNSLFIGKLS